MTSSTQRSGGALVVLALLGAEVAFLWSRTGRPGGRVIVRCSQGHAFSTIWIPGASFKAIRLGTRRFQRCPVGHHWSLVRPVGPGELTPDELHNAEQVQDSRIP